MLSGRPLSSLDHSSASVRPWNTPVRPSTSPGNWSRSPGQTNRCVLLTVFFALTVFLTQPMSNQAAAIVILPIAIQTALHLKMNPRTFVMMVAIAASCSYLTPLEPACLMVYGPGRYRFADFVRIGSLLTILIYLISIVLVPLVWPLK